MVMKFEDSYEPWYIFILTFTTSFCKRALKDIKIIKVAELLVEMIND